jgi:hypothetical protein
VIADAGYRNVEFSTLNAERPTPNIQLPMHNVGTMVGID